jgi:hypothetical protein
MTQITTTWSSATIKFQTAAILPAPYAYYYTLHLTPEAEALKVSLHQQYLDRDEVDEDTILDEGFTLDDDFSWKGKLAEVWQLELRKMLEEQDLETELDITENDNFIEIELHPSSGQTERLYPDDQIRWDYFLQELIQAIYESAGRERSFEIEYRALQNDEELDLKVNARFSERVITVSRNNSAPMPLPWMWVKEIMGIVFKADFIEEEAQEDQPKLTGKYLSIGDGLWYKLGTAVAEPTSTSRVLPQIENLFESLSQEIDR